MNKVAKYYKKSVGAAKNQWLKEQCEEIGHLQERHDEYNSHIKETAGVNRKQTFSNIRNEQGQVAQDDAQKKVI